MNINNDYNIVERVLVAQVMNPIRCLPKGTE